MKVTRFLATGAAFLLSAAVAGCGADPIPDLNPVPVGPEQQLVNPTAEEVDVFSLVIGDCLSVPSDDQINVTTSPLVDCSDPHEDEVYALVDAALDAYPGRDEMWEHADEMCLPFFEDYVGVPYLESELFIWAYTPSERSWASGDREIICVASASEEQQLTASIKGSGR